ncbi:response regulator receiver domain [Aeromonas veronii]|uniref:response regulator receiver domain n=1 Tax=Aeromonas veronii TaxID=654 RepID=UPI0031FBECD6
MTQKSYSELVSETYCDNAIRSVVMVDDDFISYSDLVAQLDNRNDLTAAKVNASKKAASLMQFFQSKNMLCDIDNGGTDGLLDVNRLRKSDLIIIDYHLENNSPEKTLGILSKLRSSKQMNMVVVYTNEDLDKVFMNILAKFHGGTNINQVIIEQESEELETFWQESIVPQLEARTGVHPSKDEIINYIKTGCINSVKGKLFSINEFRAVELRNYADIIAKMIFEYSITNIISLQQIDEEHKRLPIECGNNDTKWIKSNNIFITLFNKSDADDDSQDLWGGLNSSLCDWEPSYYNIIRSEIQNEIYADSLAFSINLDNDNYGQAALLNEILKNSDQQLLVKNINTIYQNIADEFLFRLSQNEDLRNFIFSTINYYSSELEAVIATKAAEAAAAEAAAAEAAQAAAIRERINYCAKKLNVGSDPKHHLNMYHALNMNLSSRNYEEKYISTGTVLFNQNNSNWFLCVSAACDMVPSQGNDAYHKRLNPHRLIRVINLFQVKETDAVIEAENSKYVYTYDNKKRRFFSVLSPESGLPKIDYFIILKHTTQSGERIAKAILLKSSLDGESIEHEEIELKLKSQLRTGYAERFQLIANNHSGRIGVDYVSAENIK